MTIRAKVAKVISEYEAALTAGSEQGVKPGDIATIFREIEVTDPDSGEPLGTVERPAVRLEIIEVRPKMSVGQTYETVAQKEGDIFDVFFRQGTQRIRLTETEQTVDRRTVLISGNMPAEIIRPQPVEAS
jgi:hypothetical protein